MACIWRLSTKRAALTCAMMAHLVSASVARAQPVLAYPPAQTQAGQLLARGEYSQALEVASARLKEAQKQGNPAAQLILDAAMSAYAAGRPQLAYSQSQEVLAALALQRGSEAMRAIALHLRADSSPPNRSGAERAADLAEAIRLLQADTAHGAGASALPEASLAMFLSEMKPKEAPPVLQLLRNRMASADQLSPMHRRWVVIGLAQSFNLFGQHAAAEKLLTPLLVEMDAALGELHPHTLYAGHQLGFALRRQAKGLQASEQLQAVWSGRVNVLGQDHPLTLQTATLLVRQLRDARKFDEALIRAREIEAASARTDGVDSARHLSAFNAVAEVLMEKGELAEALKVQERAYLRLEQIAPGGQAHESAQFTMAQILARLRRDREAEELFEKINAQDQQRYPPGHHLRWATLNGLAYIRGEQRDYVAQLAILDRLERQVSQEVPATHPGLVSVRNNRAASLIQLGRIDDAIEVLTKIATSLANERPPNDEQLLRARAQLATAQANGGKLSLAISLHEEVLSLRTSVLPKGHPELANSWHSLGYALDRAGRHVEALKAYEQALEIRSARYTYAHPETLRSARALGGLLAEVGKLQDAATVYGKGLEGAETLREFGQHAEWLRQADFAEVVGLYKNYARVLGKLGRWEEAFRVIDLSKARTLRETTHRQVSVISSRLELSELQELAALERDVAELSSTIATSGGMDTQQQVSQVFNSSFLSTASKLTRQRMDKVRSLAQLRSALEAKYGWPRVDNELGAQTQDASDFLSTQSAFLSFSKLGDGLLVTLLEPDGSITGRVSDNAIAGLTSSMQALRTVLSEPGGVDALNAGKPGRPAMALWRLKTGGYSLLDLAEPAPEGAEEESSADGLHAYVSQAVETLIPPRAWNYRRLLVSPDAEMSVIPLEALHRKDRILVQDHDIVYAQSWSMYRLLKRRESVYSSMKRKELLVIGDPVYAPLSESATGQVRGHALIGRDTGGGEAAFEHLRWRNLPGAAAETYDLAKLYGLAAGRDVFTREQASEETLRLLQSSGELARYRMVLFAAHGYLDSATPDRSSIVLTQHPKPTSGDGYLTAAEWRALSVRSDLVFLSACDTGLGQIVSGEGVVGLPLSMFAAGNQNTILTLWPIYDTSSSEFVKRFFERVKAGASFSDALARTKRDFASGAAGDAWTAPAYWAPFVLHGH